MSANSCDLVYVASQIIPNVTKGINGEEYTGLKIEKGALADLIEKNISEGLLLIFSSKSGKLVDIIYKKDMDTYLKNIKEIVNSDSVGFILVHSIENLTNSELAFSMIKNYLNLILDNCL